MEVHFYINSIKPMLLWIDMKFAYISRIATVPKFKRMDKRQKVLVLMEILVKININMSGSPRCSTVTVYLGC